MAYSPTTWVQGVTAVGPTNLNKIENGVQATAVVADAAIPKPGGPATNAGLVWNGSSWVAATLVDANIAAGAAIAYSKLSLAGSIVNNDIAASAGIAQSKLANGPGFEVGYDQITVGVSVTSATESAGTTVITCAAHTFDGSPVIAEFFTPQLVVGDTLCVCLFEGATEIGRLGNSSITTQTPGAIGKLRFTPTAASHTYTVTAFRTATNGTVTAGVGGTSAFVPAYIRFTKV